jgi:hypothetical protein
VSVYNNIFLGPAPNGGNKINPKLLFDAGPLINVVISLPKALETAYTQQNNPLPQPLSGIALIDTGAKKTCVQDSIMQKLKVSTIGQVTSNTANGARQCNLYPAHFSFPSAHIEIDFTSVVEVNLTGQTFNGQQIIALIGRDVLANCVFIYNGALGMYTLSM